MVAIATRARFAPDDAALTFRYAERLAAGHGLSFNDHERVNGASNGLYTLALGGLRWIGLPVEGTALAMGALAFVAVIVLSWRVASSLGGARGGAVAVVILLVASPFRSNALSGMEASVSALLGLSAVAALRWGWEWWAGVLLGLAVWHRLDAGFLAVAMVCGVLLARRRLPWRLTLAAVGVAMPYLIFCQVHFGSILPQSARSKFSGGADDPSFPQFDRLWVIAALMGVLPCLVAAVPVVLDAWHDRGLDGGAHHGSDASAAVLALAVWPVLHGTFFSLVPMGAPWPWYLTVLVPPIAILSGSGVGRWWDDRGRSSAREARPGLSSLLAATGAAFVAACVVFCAQASIRGALAPDSVDDRWQRNDRAAATWLAGVVGPDDVIDSRCWGQPGFRSPLNPVIDPCRLNSLTSPGPARWVTIRTKDRDDDRSFTVDFCERQRFGRDGDPAQVVVLERSSFGGDCG